MPADTLFVLTGVACEASFRRASRMPEILSPIDVYFLNSGQVGVIAFTCNVQKLLLRVS